MGAHSLRSEAITRGARMLRTALGPAIAAWLEEPGVIEVMLNPDGRIWIDRLTDGLADTGAWLAPADGERIIRLVAHHVGAEVHPVAHVFRPNCPKQASALKACFRRSSRRLPLPSASRRSPSSRSTITSPPESCRRSSERLAARGREPPQGADVDRTQEQHGILPRPGSRPLEAIAARVAAETSLTYQPASGCEHVAGIYRQRVTLASGRFAMIDDGLGFSLVPWSPSLEHQFGKQVSGIAMSGGNVDWSFGRKRGLGI